MAGGFFLVHPLDDEGNIFFRIELPVHPLDGGELLIQQ